MVSCSSTLLVDKQSLPSLHFPPQLHPAIRQMVQDEIGQDIRQLRFRVLYSEPTKPRQGTVVYADGTAWDPGSGEGAYMYDGTNWILLWKFASAIGDLAWVEKRIASDTYTLLETDRGKTLIFTQDTNPITVTIPTGLTAPFRCWWMQADTQTITFVGDGTLSPLSRGSLLDSAGQYAQGEIWYSNSLEAFISGDLA